MPGIITINNLLEYNVCPLQTTIVEKKRTYREWAIEDVLKKTFTETLMRKMDMLSNKKISPKPRTVNSEWFAQVISARLGKPGPNVVEPSERTREMVNNHIALVSKNFFTTFIESDLVPIAASMPINVQLAGTLVELAIDVIVETPDTKKVTIVQYDFSSRPTTIHRLLSKLDLYFLKRYSSQSVSQKVAETPIYSWSSLESKMYVYPGYSPGFEGAVSVLVEDASTPRIYIRSGYWCTTCKYLNECTEMLKREVPKQ